VKKIKILSVVGARPNFIKLVSVHKALLKYKDRLNHTIVHTGQHYDYELSQIFFKDLKLPKPKIHLGIGPLSQNEQVARIIKSFKVVMHKERPDLVIVYGDVNSTLACSLAAASFFSGRDSSKESDQGDVVPFAHIESGLRSFDLTMPEEINRIVTDHVSGMLFVTEPAGVKNLLHEKISKKRIHLVGDVMIDTLKKFEGKFRASKVLSKLKLHRDEYVIVTLHRPANVDNKRNAGKIVSLLEKISMLGLKIVFPVHPRTRKMFRQFGLSMRLSKIKDLKLTAPVNYTDFMKLLAKSKFVITDSGGIQSEATFLKIPCLTLRETSEKPETIKLGTVTLCGLNMNLVMKKVREILDGKYKRGRIPPLMDGKAAERIGRIICRSVIASSN
jgi:UDP-N-acetylglucosamine 2-epimerase (non-hydrolysing)